MKINSSKVGTIAESKRKKKWEKQTKAYVGRNRKVDYA